MTKTSTFLAAGLMLALTSIPTNAQDATDPNAPGTKELGIDISRAGTTGEENRNYVNSLPTEQQAKVKEACLAQLVEPVEDHPPVIIAFCKNLEATQ